MRYFVKKLALIYCSVLIGCDKTAETTGAAGGVSMAELEVMRLHRDLSDRFKMEFPNLWANKSDSRAPLLSLMRASGKDLTLMLENIGVQELEIAKSIMQDLMIKYKVQKIELHIFCDVEGGFVKSEVITLECSQ